MRITNKPRRRKLARSDISYSLSSSRITLLVRRACFVALTTNTNRCIHVQMTPHRSNREIALLHTRTYMPRSTHPPRMPLASTYPPLVHCTRQRANAVAKANDLAEKEASFDAHCERVNTGFARRHYETVLLRKVFRGLHGAVKSKWMSRMERACKVGSWVHAHKSCTPYSDCLFFPHLFPTNAMILT